MITRTVSIAAAALCGLMTAAAANPVKVNIGYATAADYLPAFVSKENGCFASNGIDAQFTRIPVTTNMPAAIIADTLQIGANTATLFLPAVENGLDLVAVAGGTHLLKGNETLSLVTSKVVTVKSGKDLIGKRIGVPGINSVADVMFRKWLKNSGVNLADVTFIETPFPQMSDLLRAGTVDGVLAVEPIRSRIVGAGVGARIPEEYYVAVSPDSILAFWIATTAWAKANPDVIAKLRGCLADGIAFIKTNPEDAQAIEKQYLGFNSPVYPTMTASAKASDFQFFVDLAREFGLVRKIIDVNTLVVP
jgi:NitT/TauT family transport system substrate-binding protein